MTARAGHDRAGAWWRAVVAAALVLAGVVLYTPKRETPLFYDSLSYAAQSLGVARGHGNRVEIGGETFPGFYPIGFPALVAPLHWVLGEDLRNGIHAVWLCAMASLALCAWLASREGGGWAALLAILVLMGSPLFRETARGILSQQPTLLLFALLLAMFARARGFGLAFATGLLAQLSLLVRFANVALPVAMLLVELWPSGHRAQEDGPDRRARRVGLVAGMAIGASVVLLHNHVYFGGPLRTGYDYWGQSIAGSFSLSYVLDPPVYPQAPDGSEWGWPLLATLTGMGRLYTPPVFVFALVGLVHLLRGCGRTPGARRGAALAAAAVACQYLLQSTYYFRADSHVVHTLAYVAPLAAIGAAACLPRAALAAAALAAAAWLGWDASRHEPPSARAVQALERYEALRQAAGAFEGDAVLVSAGDPAMVDTLFVITPERRILCVGPFEMSALTELAERELGGRELTAGAVVAYIREQLARGRPVYFDTFGPARVVVPLHRELKRRVARAFDAEPTEVPLILRLRPPAG